MAALKNWVAELNYYFRVLDLKLTEGLPCGRLMALRANSFHYPSLIREAGLCPDVPVISCKNVSNLFSISYKNC